MNLIKQNDKAQIWQIPSGEYEVWILLFNSVGKNKGFQMVPGDEDFGVFAWVSYSRPKAEVIFDEITTGKRTIRPMIEEG